jgi:hypothetical protein
MKEVTLQIQTEDGRPEERAELTMWLRDQIRNLPVESVEIPKAAAIPEGARSGDPFSWGALVIAIAPTVIEQLLNFLRDRLKRQKTSVKVRVECEGKILVIDGEPGSAQFEAITEFLKDLDLKKT